MASGNTHTAACYLTNICHASLLDSLCVGAMQTDLQVRVILGQGNGIWRLQMTAVV